ncbi:MAG: P-II family nitrogen regulator [Firmicutes bacterium]|nr:P-II family nitrogen regulator [Bacillota bacterium]
MNPVEDSATFVIVNTGKGTNVLQEAKKIGVTRGAIFLGKGTVRNRILELLGFDEVKKEIVIMLSDAGLEGRIHAVIREKFQMDKPNYGIMFSLPVKKVISINHCPSLEAEMGVKTDMGDMEYEVIFTIIDRGQADEVVDAAKDAGAPGATIINARGSGAHEDSKFFGIHIEPEKEIVLVVVKKKKTEAIIESIKGRVDIDEPGGGIMFVMDVNRTSGLSEESYF